MMGVNVDFAVRTQVVIRQMRFGNRFWSRRRSQRLFDRSNRAQLIFIALRVFL